MDQGSKHSRLCVGNTGTYRSVLEAAVCTDILWGRCSIQNKGGWGGPLIEN